MSKENSKKGWTIVLIVCIIIAIICIGVLVWLHLGEAATDRELQEAVKSQTEKSTEFASDPWQTAEHEQEQEPEPEPADVPIDFEYLKGINEDIYGWIDLTGTGQSYPVLSNASNPDYYIHKDINGQYSANGSLYSQSTFNEIEFVDPCTVIYGHNMNNGAMFGKLQRTASSRNLDDAENENNYFTLYTPTKIEKYRIYASGVYSNDNILYYYDFSNEDSFNAFFEEFENYPTGAHYISSDFKPQFGDELVILSTCYSANHTYRFITVGVMVEKEGI